jgi:phosphate:Na+ symporter
MTWAAHSSVAVVLLVMSFAAKGVVPLHAALAMVLGANLGTAINPVLEGATGPDPAGKRLPIGNMLNRALGCVLALALLKIIGPFMAWLEPSAARAVADFHTAFNLALALVFLPLLGPYARLLRYLLPSRVAAADPSRPMYLDPTAHETPAIALANAEREALRMVDVFDAMLNGVADALIRGERKRVSETKTMDDILDRLNAAIAEYLTALDVDDLTDADQQRLSEILTFTTNLEHAGDVVEKNVLGTAAKRFKRGLTFSEEGQAEIERFLKRLQDNIRAAAAVFMTKDERATRQLADEKQTFRNLEEQATQAHFARMRAGRIESVETSGLHLDLVRDFKQINSHLVAAAAYPVLKEQGGLLSSRLKRNE